MLDLKIDEFRVFFCIGDVQLDSKHEAAAAYVDAANAYKKKPSSQGKAPSEIFWVGVEAVCAVSVELWYYSYVT